MISSQKFFHLIKIPLPDKEIEPVIIDDLFLSIWGRRVPADLSLYNLVYNETYSFFGFYPYNTPVIGLIGGILFSPYGASYEFFLIP